MALCLGFRVSSIVIFFSLFGKADLRLVSAGHVLDVFHFGYILVGVGLMLCCFASFDSDYGV